MRLSCGGAVSLRTISIFREAIMRRRKIIRHHRDQRGDDRCWLDDYLVWAMLADSPPAPYLLPSLNQAMIWCHEFYTFRRACHKDPLPPDAILDKKLWNDDLGTMTLDQLIRELIRIQQAIRQHRDIIDRPRTIDDDRLLYSVLPEKIPADFRLPPKEDFLGEAKAPHAGCPAFWKSHSACPSSCHNLHQWGPCN